MKRRISSQKMTKKWVGSDTRRWHARHALSGPRVTRGPHKLPRVSAVVGGLNVICVKSCPRWIKVQKWGPRSNGYFASAILLPRSTVSHFGLLGRYFRMPIFPFSSIQQWNDIVWCGPKMPFLKKNQKENYCISTSVIIFLYFFS